MTARRRTLVASLLALSASAASITTTNEAAACGGFFCSSSPVDQTAEHILFTVNADHTITAYVQIQYSGDKDGFAWIVPAPGVPTLGADFPGQALLSLDSATQPQYFKNVCNGGRLALTPNAGSQATAGAAEDKGVTVYAAKVVGPYETVTLGGDTADEVVTWLKDHQFRFTDAMIPLLQPYVEGGLHFVAMRLTADKTAADITPLVMTYDGDKPMIPLRLTAAAAQPEMGIVTWILSDKRWAPENYFDLKIPDDLIEFDQYGYQNNYLTVVSREADKVGGEAFVTEYAKPTAPLVQTMQNQFAPTPEGEAARTALVQVLQEHPYLTRLYTRMSAEEMIDDPLFMVAGDSSDVDNVHDLTPKGFDYSTCPTQPPTPPVPDPCSFSYCGRSGACVAVKTQSAAGATSDAVAACVCTNTATARPTATGAAGVAAVYCEPTAMNFDAAAGSLFDAACDNFDCGVHGACVSMNGNPTCQCEGGYGAVVTQAVDPSTGAATTQVSCEKVTGRVPAPPVLPKIGQTHISTTGSNASSSSGGCSQSRGSRAPVGEAAALFLGFGALVAGRRRRRVS